MERSYDLDIGKAVCIFGSAREHLPPEVYKAAEAIAKGVAKLGFAVITGAGEGIMGAANKGAFENGGLSIGVNIQLPFEQTTNPYIHKAYEFETFYARKCMLVRNSEVFVVMPGGAGSLDEFSEVLTLVQCGKLNNDRLIVLVGKSFWGGLISWMKEEMEGITMSPEDFDLFTLVDTAEEALELIEEFDNKIKE